MTLLQGEEAAVEARPPHGASRRPLATSQVVCKAGQEHKAQGSERHPGAWAATSHVT